MMANLSNISVLLTGAAGGIGRSIAEAFAAAGARMALVDILDTRDLAGELGPQHSSYRLDLTNPQDIKQTVSKVGGEFGIDIVINNAGLGMVFSAEQMDVENWDRTFAINLRAPWLVAAAALPFLKHSARAWDCSASMRESLPTDCWSNSTVFCALWPSTSSAVSSSSCCSISSLYLAN